jgi:hypothetical protein
MGSTNGALHTLSAIRFASLQRRSRPGAAAGISGRAERKGIMSPIGQNLPRLRLDPESYETLRQQILRRDGWRCQSCGPMSNLEVHHQESRSQSGDDSAENLITLCTECHACIHRRGIRPLELLGHLQALLSHFLPGIYVLASGPHVPTQEPGLSTESALHTAHLQHGPVRWWCLIGARQTGKTCSASAGRSTRV